MVEFMKNIKLLNFTESFFLIDIYLILILVLVFGNHSI